MQLPKIAYPAYPTHQMSLSLGTGTPEHSTVASTDAHAMAQPVGAPRPVYP